jgi:hypothetical protein
VADATATLVEVKAEVDPALKNEGRAVGPAQVG